MSIDPQSLYIQLGRLVEATPNLLAPVPFPRETQEWLGRVGALIALSDEVMDIAEFNTYVASLSMPTMQLSASQELMVVIYRALAKAELKAPQGAHGTFIPAGNAFDALAVLAKVLGQAKSDLLIVDPYLDEKVLTDFAGLAAERVSIRLLADHKSVKPTLKPAATRWVAQYGQNRPLAVKLAPQGALHDRLVVADRTTAWVLTQSLNAFAARSPATVVRVDDGTAALKIAAYEGLWQSATPL